MFDSHIRPARMQLKPPKKQNWPSVRGPLIPWPLVVGSRDVWVSPWCCWRSKWWWTNGMPLARMWAPILSWDALLLQWFPEYRVLGNTHFPPWFKEDRWSQTSTHHSPKLSSLCRMCRRMSEDVALTREFIVWMLPLLTTRSTGLPEMKQLTHSETLT